VSVDDLIATSERAAQVARKMSEELREAGLEAQALLLGHVAQALENAARDAIAAPDVTPASGLEALIDELEHPAAMLRGPQARKLARQLVRGRSLVRALLSAAEIVGDVEVIAEAQAWLEEET
jgi:hypothetical protein